MFPRTLAIVEDNVPFASLLAEWMRLNGVEVTVFHDGDDLLVADDAYGFDFYLIDLELPGVAGLDVVRLLRRRVQAGIVVVTGNDGPGVVDAVLEAGADMYLVKPASTEQIGIAVRAVFRRNRRLVVDASTWRLNVKARTLTTPGGVAVSLGDSDLAVIGSFVDRGEQTVSHAELCQRLGREASDEAANWLHATIYRLRRRVEAMSSETLPLHSRARVGYAFRAPLLSV